MHLDQVHGGGEKKQAAGGQEHLAFIGDGQIEQTPGSQRDRGAKRQPRMQHPPGAAANAGHDRLAHLRPTLCTSQQSAAVS